MLSVPGNLGPDIDKKTCEFGGEPWVESAATVAAFDEIRSREGPAFQQVDDQTVDDGSDGFDEVEREAVAVLLVDVDDAKAGVESEVS